MFGLFKTKKKDKTETKNLAALSTDELLIRLRAEGSFDNLMDIINKNDDTWKALKLVSEAYRIEENTSFLESYNNYLNSGSPTINELYEQYIAANVSTSINVDDIHRNELMEFISEGASSDAQSKLKEIANNLGKWLFLPALTTKKDFPAKYEDALKRLQVSHKNAPGK